MTTAATALGSGPSAEIVAVVLLVGSLLFAVLRPRGLPEAVVAVPAALAVVALGVVPAAGAWRALRDIGPTVGFLAAILLFGHLCAEAGVFDYLGAVAGGASKGSPRRLLVLVISLAAAVTATLTLDATVVLLTPIVLATTEALGVRARPHSYACSRLANSASLLLPVSNLTNLLAFNRSGLSFGRFTALMVLPWVLVCAAEWALLRSWFRADLRAPADSAILVPRPPRYALSVLGVTVALFVVASSVDVAPAWAALLGCAALVIPRLRRKDVRLSRLVAEANPAFCAFVLALAVVVEGVTRHGLGKLLGHLAPSGASFLALLGLAVLAAAMANVLNNLPATLAMVPVVAGHPAGVLAVLLGVNIGPNLAYPGSLATLLWRRQLPNEYKPKASEFHLLGALSVPLLLMVATGGLWVATSVLGA